MEFKIGSVFDFILCACGCGFCRLSLDVVLNQYSSNLIIVIRTKPFFYWENSKSGSVRGFQGVHKPYFEHFCLFSEIFCLFLQFFSLESCYIWFTICLEYPTAYVYSCCPGKIQNQVPSGGIRG